MLTEVNVPIDEATLSRILERVVIDNESGCWLWQGSATQWGYGQITINRITKGTHVLMALISHGPCPDGLEVSHDCHVNNCCNPAHLKYVTHTENMKMRVGRGRRKNLKMVDAEEIRLRYWAGQDHKIICEDFNISGGTLYKIMKYESYNNMK